MQDSLPFFERGFSIKYKYVGILLLGILVISAILNWETVSQFFKMDKDVFANITSIFSLCVAIFLGYVGIKFNQNSLYQTKIAFEQFRPILKAELNTNNNGLKIINEGNFDAVEIKYWYKSADFDKENSKPKVINNIQSCVLTPKNYIEIGVESNEGRYRSIVIFYKNYGSGLTYVYGINYFNGIPIKNIGEAFEDAGRVGEKYIDSPIRRTSYKSLINTLSPENQIKGKIIVEHEIINFVDEIGQY